MSSNCCSSKCKCPEPFFKMNDTDIVHDVFFAVVDDKHDKKHVFYPAFPTLSGYSGQMIKKSIIHENQSYIVYIPKDHKAPKPLSSLVNINGPQLVSRSCSTRCSLSSSERLEKEREKDILILAQNGRLSCPLDCDQSVLYQSARNMIIYNYMCEPCSSPPKKHIINNVNESGNCFNVIIDNFREESNTVLQIYDNTFKLVHRAMKWEKIDDTTICIYPNGLINVETSEPINESAVNISDLNGVVSSSAWFYVSFHTSSSFQFLF